MLSRNQRILIELPPEGLFLREIAITAVNALSYFGEMNVEVRGNSVELHSKDLAYSLSRAREGLKELLNIKVSGGMRWPPIHRNDKGTLKKSRVVASKIEALQSYADLTKEFIDHLPELSASELKVSYEQDQLLLGSGDMALPQLLKIEFYEGLLTYGKPYLSKIDIRLDDCWLALLASGLAVAYTGYIKFVTTPKILESTRAFASIVSIELAELFEGVRIKVTIPYLLYVHILARLLAEESFRASHTVELTKSLARLFEDYEPPREHIYFRTHTLEFDRKTYRELSREDIIFSASIFEFLDRIGDRRCLDQLRSFIRMTSRAGIDARASKILNAITYLYEAIHGAKDTAFTAYYLTRIATDASEEGRSLFTRTCAEKIVRALVPIGVKT